MRFSYVIQKQSSTVQPMPKFLTILATLLLWTATASSFPMAGWPITGDRHFNYETHDDDLNADLGTPTSYFWMRYKFWVMPTVYESGHAACKATQQAEYPQYSHLDVIVYGSGGLGTACELGDGSGACGCMSLVDDRPGVIGQALRGIWWFDAHQVPMACDVGDADTGQFAIANVDQTPAIEPLTLMTDSGTFFCEAPGLCVRQDKQADGMTDGATPMTCTWEDDPILGGTTTCTASVSDDDLQPNAPNNGSFAGRVIAYKAVTGSGEAKTYGCVRYQ